MLHILPADFVCRKSVGRGPFRLCRSPGSASLLESLRCDGRFIRGRGSGPWNRRPSCRRSPAGFGCASCRMWPYWNQAAPWRAPSPGYAPGRPPGIGVSRRTAPRSWCFTITGISTRSGRRDAPNGSLRPGVVLLLTGSNRMRLRLAGGAGPGWLVALPGGESARGTWRVHHG